MRRTFTVASQGMLFLAITATLLAVLGVPSPTPMHAARPPAKANASPTLATNYQSNLESRMHSIPAWIELSTAAGELNSARDELLRASATDSAAIPSALERYRRAVATLQSRFTELRERLLPHELDLFYSNLWVATESSPNDSALGPLYAWELPR